MGEGRGAIKLIVVINGYICFFVFFLLHIFIRQSGYSGLLRGEVLVMGWECQNFGSIAYYSMDLRWMFLFVIV